MAKFGGFLLYLFWFSGLIIFSILLFARGFLMTREVLSNVSSCLSHKTVDHLPHEDNGRDCDFAISKKATSDEALCLEPQARVVLLIVDALRYDFLLYDARNESPLPYQNRMPIFSRLLEVYPNNTRVYKFIADPPTTTMQRLKALTTGSLPTFIDAGSNFATQEITEDNIIDQVVLNRYSAVFTGDDTWTSLYPERFLRNYSYPSFDVWDLDTVDNGVKKHLFPELENHDWNLLIAHFLGVDHCGHRYGPSHPEMKRKLEEINSVIENVVLELPEDAILVVVGDHGMTATGDHGGESLEEITAGMFVYSKDALQSFGERPSSVKQIDLIPTLSSILGIPIPFQNLGIIIIDIIPQSENVFCDWHQIVFALWENVKQIKRYLIVNSQESNVVNNSILSSYLQKYSDLERQFLALGSKKNFLQFEKKVRSFLNDIRSLYEDAWVRFDTALMTQGLIFLLFPLIFVFIVTEVIPKKNLVKIFADYNNSLNFLSPILFITVLIFFSSNTNRYVFPAFGIFSNIFLVGLIVRNWKIFDCYWYDGGHKNGIMRFFSNIIVSFSMCIMFSNSFINEESEIQLFFLMSVILLGSISTTHKVHSFIFSDKLILKFKFFLISVIFAFPVRASMYFWRCRLEQEWCFKSLEITDPAWFKFKSSKLQWSTSGFFLILFVILTKQWLKHFGNLNGLSAVALIAKLVPTVIVVCTCGFWVLEQPSDQQTNLKVVNSLALCVYVLVLISIYILFLNPLCIYMLPKDFTVSTSSNENSFHRIYQKLKGYLTLSKWKQNVDVSAVYGLETVYSAAFLLLGIHIVLLFTLLLGVATSPSAIIMFSTLCFVLVITSLWRIGNAERPGDLLDVPNFCVIIWTVLCQYFFYATGHQPTFSNINWEAAFLGTSGLIRNNYILGTLVVVNTFCSNILMGMLLPLLVVSPFTILTALPSMIPKKDEFFKRFSKGELIIFEEEDRANASMFTLACKYLVAHGMRVFFSMVAATIHCRHLMVSSIFAPKLIFESIGMCVTIASVLFGYCLFYRVNIKIVHLMRKLNKST